MSAALARVLEYMEKIRPRAAAGAGAEPPPSMREHITEAPTLLPTVIFQDLVFGAELGSGAFSTVRYCKHVQRGTAARLWPEYAAKVLRSQLMKELGYERSVRREIAVLRQLTHPGISRLVASFRWKGDVYLLLEYASRGDLHTALRRYGSLALPNARFIFAEVCVALRSVHELGYTFGDLKPENILLTASGHAKLTDFGAARPMAAHPAAAAAIRAARNVIMELRDGDWRAKKAADDAAAAGVAMEVDEGDANGDGDGDEGEGEGEEDGRLEGTAVYLSPELVGGAAPSVASDCWALGCTLYHALCGRPPVWADSQAEVMKRIVKFDGLDDGKFPDGFDADARELATALMTPAVDARLGGGGVSDVLVHDFFGGLDVDSLYSQTPPPLKGGIAAPAPHAAWSRRQNSMMWSPLPQRYEFGEEGGGLEPIEETSVEANAPFTPTLAPLRELLPPPGAEAGHHSALVAHREVDEESLEPMEA